MNYLDLITGSLSFVFTLLILSYLLGDNPLFRMGVYIFVGVSSGYIAAIAFWQVLYPRLIYPLSNGELLPLVPSFMAILILMKISPRLSGMASIAMAFLVGVGAAVTIAGAVSGTLIPQVMGTIDAFTLTSLDPNVIFEMFVKGGIVLVGVIFSLSYFHFGARPKPDGSMRRAGLIEISAWIGRIFIGITLGAIFAGVYAAALTAFIERISSMIAFIENLMIHGISL